MSPLELTTSITALANLIACNVSDDDTLALLGAIFTQTGDTLSTIVAQRALCDKKNSQS